MKISRTCNLLVGNRKEIFIILVKKSRGAGALHQLYERASCKSKQEGLEDPKCVSECVVTPSVISRLTKILREEVVACLAELDRSSFIAKKNLWKFKHYEITEKRAVALTT